MNNKPQRINKRQEVVNLFCKPIIDDFTGKDGKIAPKDYELVGELLKDAVDRAFRVYYGR